MGELVRFVPKAERERACLIREARAIYDSVFPPCDPVREHRNKASASHGASAQAFIAARGPIMIAIMWSIHWHKILGRFAEIWIASFAPTFLVGYQFAS